MKALPRKQLVCMQAIHQIGQFPEAFTPDLDSPHCHVGLVGQLERAREVGIVLVVVEAVEDDIVIVQLDVERGLRLIAEDLARRPREHGDLTNPIGGLVVSQGALVE